MITVSLLLLVLLAPLAAHSGSTDDPSEEQLEAEILRLVNRHRTSKDLEVLEPDCRLTRQARVHSRRMAAGEVDFGHEGFEERIKESGIKIASAAENVGTNLGMNEPARAAVQAWLNSPGHRTNIEGRYDLTGIGAARARDGSWLFTQLFVKSRQSPSKNPRK